MLQDHPELVRFDNGLGTLLMVAAYENQLDNAKLLVEYGADVNHFCEDDNSSPIHAAVMGENPEMLEFLVSRGAKAQNEQRVTIYAVNQAVDQNDALRMVKTLESAGADLDYVFDHDWTDVKLTLLDQAEVQGQDLVLEYLKSR